MNVRMAGFRRPCLGLLMIICGVGMLLGATGCNRVAPVRTLPSWVRGIYIPMFKNSSFEPGIEEIATRATQEAFLADGRLSIVPREDADLMLVAKITDWEETAKRTRGDKIATTNNVLMRVSLQLFEPLNTLEPIADLGELVVETGVYIDTRSSEYISEPERKQQLMNILADNIVFNTINGFPPLLATAPVGATLPPVSSPTATEPSTIVEPGRNPTVK